MKKIVHEWQLLLILVAMTTLVTAYKNKKETEVGLWKEATMLCESREKIDPPNTRGIID